MILTKTIHGFIISMFVRGRGGIGIRARLRGVSGNGYGFKSRRPHIKEIPVSYCTGIFLLFYCNRIVYSLRIISSEASFRLQIITKTGLQPISDSNPVLVEMRGVEPLSENPSEGLSPSAFRVLNSLEKRPRKNECQGSFINTDSAAKLKRNSFPASMTPAG